MSTHCLASISKLLKPGLTEAAEKSDSSTNLALEDSGPRLRTERRCGEATCKTYANVRNEGLVEHATVF